jgi:hypothetical protein
MNAGSLSRPHEPPNDLRKRCVRMPYASASKRLGRTLNAEGEAEFVALPQEMG